MTTTVPDFDGPDQEAAFIADGGVLPIFARAVPGPIAAQQTVAAPSYTDPVALLLAQLDTPEAQQAFKAEVNSALAQLDTPEAQRDYLQTLAL